MKRLSNNSIVSGVVSYVPVFICADQYTYALNRSIVKISPLVKMNNDPKIRFTFLSNNSPPSF